MADSVIRIGPELERDLVALELSLDQWSKQARQRLVTAHKRIGSRHRSEAVKRVPVDTSRLKQAILTNTYETPTTITTETGTNVDDYPIFLEFGSKHIAGGAVLALGEDVGITDAQAIHTWKAKLANEIAKTSFSRDAEGKLWNNPKKFQHAVVKGPQEQMPWLRPAFNSIREWAIQQIEAATAPPEKK